MKIIIFIKLLVLLNIFLQLAILFYKNYPLSINYRNNEISILNPTKNKIPFYTSLITLTIIILLSYKIFNFKESKLLEFGYIYLIFFIICLLSIINIYANFYHIYFSKKKLLVFNETCEKVCREIYNNLISEKRAVLQYEDLVEISKGNKLVKNIDWTDKIGMKSTSNSRSKVTTYGYIFDLFHEHFIKDGIKNIRGEKKSELLDFIIDNFAKDGKPIKKQNLDKSFCGWKPANN